MERTFLSAAELARYLGVHQKQVYRLLKRGLPGTQATGKWAFDKAQVDRWLAQDAQSSGPPTPPVIAGEEDPFVDQLFSAEDLPCGHSHAPMEQALGWFNGGRVSAATFEFTRGDCRWGWPPELVGRSLNTLWLGRRQLGVAHRPGTPTIDLVSLGDARRLRLGLRTVGAASRTLLEHRLLRAGLPVDRILAGQPEYPSHQELIRGLYTGEIDAALVPHHQARRWGLESTPIAALDLFLVYPPGLEWLASRLIARLTTRRFRDTLRAWEGLELPGAGLEPEHLGPPAPPQDP